MLSSNIHCSYRHTLKNAQLGTEAASLIGRLPHFTTRINR